MGPRDSCFGIPKRLVVSKLGVAVGLDGLADDLGKLVGRNTIRHHVAARVNQSQRAVGDSIDSSSLIKPI